jgi:hypothetical protein
MAYKLFKSQYYWAILVLNEKTNNKAWYNKRGRVDEKGLVKVLEKSLIKEDLRVD